VRGLHVIGWPMLVNPRAPMPPGAVSAMSVRGFGASVAGRRVAPSAPPTALDRRGSKFTPPVRIDGKAGEKVGHRRALLRTISKLLPDEPVSRCGRYASKGVMVKGEPGIALRADRTTAYAAGTVTCKSTWMCPVCGGAIAEGKRTELARVIKAHNCTGGHVVLLTLTQGHTGFDDPENMRKSISKRWSKTISGKPWERAAKAGLVLDVGRAIEVTCGETYGYHPHIHALIFFHADARSNHVALFMEWFIQRWISKTKDDGYKCSAAAQKWDIARDAAKMGDYMAKWGVDYEVTYSNVKKGRKGRTLFQVAADYARTGNPVDGELFKRGALAMKGCRQLTGFQKLKKLYAMEIRDEALMKKELKRPPIVAAVADDTWREICRKNIDGQVLQAAMVGLLNVLSVVGGAGISISGIYPPEFARNRSGGIDHQPGWEKEYF